MPVPYPFTVATAAKFLNRQPETIRRYVLLKQLSPIEEKSIKGTLEYKFCLSDLEQKKLKLKRHDDGVVVPSYDDVVSLEMPLISQKEDDVLQGHHTTTSSSTPKQESINLERSTYDFILDQSKTKDTIIAQMLNLKHEENILALKALPKKTIVIGNNVWEIKPI